MIERAMATDKVHVECQWGRTGGLGPPMGWHRGAFGIVTELLR